MKITVVAPLVPHRDVRHAGGHFLYDHVGALVALGVEVTLVCLDDDPSHTDRVLPAGVTPVLVVAPLAGGIRERLGDGLRSRLHRDAPHRSAVRALVAGGLLEHARHADLVELHWTSMATLVPMLRRAGVDVPIGVLEHDVGAQAQRDRIRRYGSRRARLARPFLDLVRDRNEARDLDLADVVLVFKAADEQLLRRIGTATPVHVVEPNLDPPPARRPRRNEHEVLFSGALARRENVEALTWLLDDVWPRVIEAVPSATLTLAGAGAPPELLARASRRVTFTGEVDDLGPFYERAAVFVAPLVVGGGLKFKVAQAMVCGLPVVATRVAVEGIVEVAPVGAFWAVTDDSVAMADALVGALRDPVGAAAVGRVAEDWASAHYSFVRSTERLVLRYSELTRR